MNKFVVSYLGGLGDTLLMTPVLRAIKETYPNSRTVVLVAPAAAFLFKGNPDADQVIGYRKGDSVLPILRSVWRADAAFLFDNTSRTRQLMWLAQVKERLGFGEKRKRFLTQHIPKREDGQRYQSECYFDLTRLMGIDRVDKTELFLGSCTSSEQKAVEAILAKAGIAAQTPLITMAPYSLDYYKDWPEESYNTVIAAMARAGYRTVLIGGNELSTKAANFPEALYLHGLSPQQSAYVISRARLMLCGCTFALHLAATTQTPILALYGKTSPTRWAAYKQCRVVRAAVDCRDESLPRMDFCATPDGNCPYDKLCLRRITPEMVIEEIEALLC